MADYLIVPGLNNSDEAHWQSQWEKRLHSVARVEQARWDVAELDRWADQIAKTLKQSQARWIIAHSFGCLATVRALSRIHEAGEVIEVQGLFLVAPADPDKFAVRELLPRSALPVPAVIVGSLSDPWFQWEKLSLLAQQWQTPLWCAGDAGHINSASGHGIWAEGWEWFQQFRQPLIAANADHPSARRHSKEFT